jgi:hypothetical protein
MIIHATSTHKSTEINLSIQGLTLSQTLLISFILNNMASFNFALLWLVASQAKVSRFQ